MPTDRAAEDAPVHEGGAVSLCRGQAARYARHYSHVGNDEAAALAGFCASSRGVWPGFHRSYGLLWGPTCRTHNGRRAQGARRPGSFKRDTGRTRDSKLGIEKDTSSDAICASTRR